MQLNLIFKKDCLCIQNAQIVSYFNVLPSSFLSHPRPCPCHSCAQGTSTFWAGLKDARLQLIWYLLPVEQLPKAQSQIRWCDE